MCVSLLIIQVKMHHVIGKYIFAYVCVVVYMQILCISMFNCEAVMQMHRMWVSALCVEMHLHTNNKPVTFGFVAHTLRMTETGFSCNPVTPKMLHFMPQTDTAAHKRPSLSSSSHKGHSAGMWRDKIRASSYLQQQMHVFILR